MTVDTDSDLGTRKKATFGVVFLTIFLDMVGFSVIFPLFPEMLDHYLERESLLGGGILTDFVISIQGLAFEGAVQNKSFRFETVIFGGVLGSLYAILQFFFAPIWGRLSDKIGRRPVLLTTLGGTCLGYGLWIFAGDFWILVLSRVLSGIASGNLSVATASIEFSDSLTGEPLNFTKYIKNHNVMQKYNTLCLIRKNPIY